MSKSCVIRLPADLVQKIDNCATAHDMTRAEVLEPALQESGLVVQPGPDPHPHQSWDEETRRLEHLKRQRNYRPPPKRKPGRPKGSKGVSSKVLLQQSAGSSGGK